MKRTLVLATIASERLADGLTLSIMFLLVAFVIKETEYSGGFMLVAALFAVATLAVLALLAFRETLFGVFERISTRFDTKASHYAHDRVQVFVNGLSPLRDLKRLPAITFLSCAVWLIELAGYYAVTKAFNHPLSLTTCVVFVVAVNFSSLIPAAPAGLGVIEAVATQVLVTLGLARELALSMVVTQHMVQFLVVLVPAVIVLVTWKGSRERAPEPAQAT